MNREERAREVLAREYEDAQDAPPGAGQRFHAANVRVIGKRDYAEWKDHAAIRAMLAFAEQEAPRVPEERTQIVRWLRQQSDKGADIGIAADKGSTRRAAYGGGSLALSRAADEIERGTHIIADIATALAAGETESQAAAVPTAPQQAPAPDAEIAALREALEAEDAYWAASRALACALPRLRPEAEHVFSAATDRRTKARAALAAGRK